MHLLKLYWFIAKQDRKSGPLLFEAGSNILVVIFMRQIVYSISHVTSTSEQCGTFQAVTFRYEVTVGVEVRQVCKQAFIKLHQITKGTIHHLASQHVNGSTGPRPCQRGKHSNRPRKISEECLNQVKEHVMMFPADESPYSRSVNTGRKYLSPLLNITIMHQLYKACCQNMSYKPVSLKSYRNVFNTHFNLSFGHPKSDTCNVCDAGIM